MVLHNSLVRIIMMSFLSIASAYAVGKDEDNSPKCALTKPNVSIKEAYVETKKGKLFFRDTEGTGPVLVLLHGSSASSFIFTPFMDYVLKHKIPLRIIAFDSPGHGNSDDFSNPEESYTHIGCARIFLEALENLNIKTFSLYGWSKGGHEAINMLGLAESQMESLIIDGTPPLPAETTTIFSKAFKPIPEIELLGKDTSLNEEEAQKFVAC